MKERKETQRKKEETSGEKHKWIKGRKNKRINRWMDEKLVQEIKKQSK